MSALFYNHATTMVGCDFHPCWRPAVSPHEVASAHFLTLAGGMSTTVTFDAKRVVLEGDEIWPVAHVPLDKPMNQVEGALGVVNLAITHAFSSSKAVLARGSVVVNGKPAACAMRGLFGWNLNCNSPIKLPTDVTMTLGTVMTTPSAADFLRALLTFFIDAAFSLLGKGLEKLLKNRLGDEIAKLTKQYVDQVIKVLVKIYDRVALKPIRERLNELLEPVRGDDLGKELGNAVHLVLE